MYKKNDLVINYFHNFAMKCKAKIGDKIPTFLNVKLPFSDRFETSNFINYHLRNVKPRFLSAGHLTRYLRPLLAFTSSP